MLPQPGKGLRGISLLQDAMMMTPAAFPQWRRALALPPATCSPPFVPLSLLVASRRAPTL